MRNWIARRLGRNRLRSGTYWEERYRDGGNSGSGSYGRLAEYKAEILNGFLRDRNVRSVVEWGCGDGNQLSLARYPHYLGIDVSPEAVARCRARFAADPEKRFLTLEEVHREGRPTAELALSLDVVFHLVEEDVFERYLADLFESAERFVIVYSSNRAAPGDAAHVRHREFTRWVSDHRPGWRLSEMIPNRYPFDPARPEDTSFADFYIFERPASAR